MIGDASGWQLEPTPWASQAACKGSDPELWFPERGDSTRPAVAICETCPVKSACLDYALRWNITSGVWGGKTARQRQSIRVRTHPARPRRLLPPHGTTARYAKDCRCDECTQAQSTDAFYRRHPGLFDDPDALRVDSIRTASRFL